MRQLVALGVLLCIANTCTKPATKSICDDEKLTCYQTEYSAYVKCIEKQRVKRQACIFGDSVQPQMVQPIQPRLVQPQYVQAAQTQCTGFGCNSQPASQVIIDTCMNSCGTTCSGNACRERCDVSCQQPQQPPQPQQPQQPPRFIQQPSQPITIIEKSSPSHPAPSPNVTTIIKLTNIVNNTNVVNVPTTINNTNINNLDLITNNTSNNKGEKCCTVVQPKECSSVHSVANKTVYRCVHRRHHTCGQQCTSNTLHAQVRQPCNGPVETCPPSVSYVPQPAPRCVYQQSWPYVSCGAQANPSCEGCYDHYGQGFEQYHGNNAPQCTGCFDDGFDTGSLYRQGPIYRPGYYHTPPCYLVGNCGYIQQPMVQDVDCGFSGCFGHELIDPGFGVQSFNPYSSYYQMAATAAPYASPYFDNAEYYVVNSNSSALENEEIDENSIVPINPYPNVVPSPYPYSNMVQSPYSYSNVVPTPYSYMPHGYYNSPVSHVGYFASPQYQRYPAFSPINYPIRIPISNSKNETVSVKKKKSI